MEFLCRADLVSEEPLVRLVDEVVSGLDLWELYARHSEGGRAYYDCSMMLKVLFFGYCDGVRSSRALSKHIRYDVRYRYFCGSLQPDFRTINRFRQMNLDLLSGYFAQIVMMCSESGLLDTSQLALDGTKIRASASSRRRSKKKRLDDLVRGFRSQLSGDIAAESGDDDLDDPGGASTSSGETGEAKEGTEQSPELMDVTNSFTDPDARYMKTSEGGKRLSYNSQIMVDKNQFIVASEVSNSADDSVQFKSMIDQSKETLGKDIDKVLADGGYYSGSNLKYAAKEGIDLYLPVTKTGRVPDERFHRDAFSYDEETDSYACPGREKLYYRRSRKRRGVTIRVYSGSASSCGSCEFRSSCTRDRVRRLEISEHYIYEREMKAKLDTEEGRFVYDRRKHLVEPVFGNIKFNLGYVRFSLRTLAKVRGEFLLMCIAHNLKKLAAHRSKLSPAFAAKMAATALIWLLSTLYRGLFGPKWRDLPCPDTNAV
jgi:transposase